MAIPSTPDVLVIGAGIIGASAAWRMSQHGLSVTIVDAEELGGAMTEKLAELFEEHAATEWWSPGRRRRIA